eukprot:GHVU01060783.1.p1 GENE.GHVU01060783.1~~GHVU01060783.1.p1  ORF type:complete len:353 (-),score=46.38 GHVU01060783.1:1717-2775(-)
MRHEDSCHDHGRDDDDDDDKDDDDDDDDDDDLPLGVGPRTKVGRYDDLEEEDDEEDDEGESTQACPVRGESILWEDTGIHFNTGTMSQNRLAAKSFIAMHPEGDFQRTHAWGAGAKYAVAYQCAGHKDDDGEPCSAKMGYRGDGEGKFRIIVSGGHASVRVPMKCGVPFELKKEILSRKQVGKTTSKAVALSIRYDLAHGHLKALSVPPPEAAEVANFVKAFKRSSLNAPAGELDVAGTSAMLAEFDLRNLPTSYADCPADRVIVIDNRLEQGEGFVWGSKGVSLQHESCHTSAAYAHAFRHSLILSIVFVLFLLLYLIFCFRLYVNHAVGSTADTPHTDTRGFTPLSQGEG